MTRKGKTPGHNYKAFPRIALVATLICSAASSSAQTDITQPGDLTLVVNGIDPGGPPPATEGVEHAIDNLTLKYLNYTKRGSGFVVQPQVGRTIVTALTFYTANDEEARDPAS